MGQAEIGGRVEEERSERERRSQSAQQEGCTWAGPVTYASNIVLNSSLTSALVR